MKKADTVCSPWYEEVETKEFVVAVKDRIEKDEFVERCGAKREAFASNLSSDIYSSLYVESIDLLREYDVYYRMEYPTFSAFLRCNYDLTSTLIDTLELLKDKSTAIFLFSPRIWLFSDPTISKILIEALIKE